eukprot:TRINITY_DN20602_c0_g1::TRINITY_DN20602_c0_g1_i1::g.12374::m.12374 TRINITY_DN20602_c0_g1::TRINITY_DN20602_c0_g1_i1::g.12374  ORF type:complete len:373 (-),score=24.10,sp/Q9WV06/ANKR2_MOUSE/32.45/3e-14,Ank_2/PF12796.2/0.00039,Ank_2/PF12796.2/3.9e-13,Ank_2/PF12796.2/7e-09,Ank_5/PF13857.1/2.5e-06,Ank_5/PF13857.1/8.5e-08,Ank/PF00023.25/0.0086,Ank/PF00023.25/29,Ank/PF00023.25/9.4e-07,Ank_4/PF13637.1/0.13,Ank_4/PF13637.1/0.00088,Ank_4/PF13637.1/0.072,Ank_4/PF13637.1/0.0012,Ank_3/PF13606.1/0.51,Ank_3/PF
MANLADFPDVDASTELCKAAFFSKIDKIHKIVKEDPEALNHQDQWGCTALIWAVVSGSVDAVKVLVVDQRARVDICDKFGSHAFTYAAGRYSNMKIIETFLSAGVDASLRNTHGSTPLHAAVLLAQTDVVKKLVESGADLVAKDKDGNRPIDLCQNDEIRSLLHSRMDKDLDHGVAAPNAPVPSTYHAPQSHCAACNTCMQPQELKRCGSCRLVQYCGETCQKAHWATHRDTCSLYAYVQASAWRDGNGQLSNPGQAKVTQQADPDAIEEITRRKALGEFIVKVQVPDLPVELRNNPALMTPLIYNEDRSLVFLLKTAQTAKRIVKIMGNEMKAYFWCSYVSKSGEISISSTDSDVEGLRIQLRTRAPYPGW